MQKTGLCARSILIVLSASAVVGCATTSNRIRETGLYTVISDANKSNYYQGGGLTDAITTAQNVARVYGEDADTISNVRNGTGMGVLGLGAIALTMAANGEGSTKFFTTAGIGGATAVTAANLYANPAYQKVLNNGEGAVWCLIDKYQQSYLVLTTDHDLFVSAGTTLDGAMTAADTRLQALAKAIAAASADTAEATEFLQDGRAALVKAKAIRTGLYEQAAEFDGAGASLKIAVVKVATSVTQELQKLEPDPAAVLASMSSIKSLAGTFASGATPGTLVNQFKSLAGVPLASQQAAGGGAKLAVDLATKDAMAALEVAAAEASRQINKFAARKAKAGDPATCGTLVAPTSSFAIVPPDSEIAVKPGGSIDIVINSASQPTAFAVGENTSAVAIAAAPQYLAPQTYKWTLSFPEAATGSVTVQFSDGPGSTPHVKRFNILAKQETPAAAPPAPQETPTAAEEGKTTYERAPHKVRLVQKTLKVAIDGAVGTETRDALKDYQENSAAPKLQVDSILGKDSFDRLEAQAFDEMLTKLGANTPDAEAHLADLRTSNAVELGKVLQHLVPGWDASEPFDKAMRQAIWKFQIDHALEITGFLDQTTYGLVKKDAKL